MADTEVKNEVHADDGDVAMEDVPEAPKKENVKLEDLFDDMDSDDEFPSSAPKNGITDHKNGSSPPPSSPPKAIASDVTEMKASDTDVMHTFYQRLFPWRFLFLWLNHSTQPQEDFMRREFAFTLQNGGYRRYESFVTHDQFKKRVLTLQPSRFEIGPVYNAPLRERKSLGGAFKPKFKELCFDIDLTDYDDVRTCCDKANICRKCWSFMTMSIRVLDAALRSDFGFRHILWVYSGRRGAHAWVCDRAARELDDPHRRSIAGYLEVIKGGAQSAKKVNLRRPLHPHLTRSLDLLKPYFQSTILTTQDPWSSPTEAEKLLRLLPDTTLTTSLRTKWDDRATPPNSAEKWSDIDAVAKTTRKLDPRQLKEAKQDIVLEYTYPRLDIEVSKKLNHLLKSPFVVHPGTGRVCVPIDPDRAEEFDPLSVPTVQGLLKEIDEWAAGNARGKKSGDDEDLEEVDKKTNGDGALVAGIQDWQKTSLKPHIDFFSDFIDRLLADEPAEGNGEAKPIKKGSNSMEF